MALLILLTGFEGIARAESERLITDRYNGPIYSPREPNVATYDPLNQALPPVETSGAFANYPLNHTLDAYPQFLNNGPTNWDVETAPQTVGTPPTDYTFEVTPTDTDFPSNYGFGSGDFTDWLTVNGTFTIGSTGGLSGYFAQVPSTTNATLTTGAFTVSSSADAFEFDYGRVSTGSTTFSVTVLSGVSYGTSTALGSLTCNTSCTWSNMTYAATDWRGGSVKLQFKRTGGSFSIDNVRTVDLVNGWDIQGNPRIETIDSSKWLTGATELVSPAFTVDASAQFGTIDIRKTVGVGSTQRKVFVLSGGSYATSTEIGYFSITSPTTIRIPLYPWYGQSIKIRLGDTTLYGLGVDNFMIQTATMSGWTYTNPDYNRALHTESGSGSFVAEGPAGSDGYDPGTALVLHGSDDIESPAFNVSANAQFLILMHRSAYTGVGTPGLHIRVLYGAGYSSVANITTSTLTSPTGDWARYAIPISAYQGDSIKLRLLATHRIYLNDIGFEGSIAPGWDAISGTDQFTVKYDDVNGTYLTTDVAGDDFIVGSSPVSAGVVANGSRSYSLGYSFGPYSNSRMKVDWIPIIDGTPAPLSSFNVYDEFAGTTSNTDYKDARFIIEEGDLPVDGGEVVQTGYFQISGNRSARLYQIGDNVARQQLSEPFSMQAGLGVDTSTGSFGWSENDISLEGGPLPLVLSRYYAGHSDRLGPLGYRWRHSFDTQLYIGVGQEHMAVLFADGGEEAFLWDGVDEWLPTDPRVKSTLTEPTTGVYEYTNVQGLRMQFNSLGLLIYVIDRNDNQIAFAYNGNDQLNEVTTLGGRKLEFAYTGSNLTSVTGPDVEVTYSYNANGDLESVTKPDEQLSEYTYSRHRLTEVFQFAQLDPDDAGELKSVIKNKLDDYNRVTKQTFPDATELQFGYQYDFELDDPFDGITSVRDRSENGVTRYFFDHFGRTEYVVTDELLVSQFVFNDDGYLTAWIDGAGEEYLFTYSPEGGLETSTDPLSQITDYNLNAQLQPTDVVGPDGVVTRNDYDLDGNLTSRIVDYGTDPENLNLTTEYEYDPGTGLMTLMIVDPLGENLITEWTYDEYGNVETKTIDPDDGIGDEELNLTWEYAYNNRGQLLVEVDPSGLRKRFSYTAAGRISQVIVDPVNDPTGTPYAVDPGVTPLNLISTYAFNTNGNLSTTTDPWCEVNFTIEVEECQSKWTYNEQGLVTDKFDTMGVRTHYQYNDNGQMSFVTQDAALDDPLGTELNLVTKYEYDDDGRLMRVTVDPTVPDGPAELNLITEYQYDNAGRLWKEIVDPSDLNLVTEYLYDDKGRLEFKRLPGSPTPTWTYEYDSNDRLIRTTDPESRITENVYDRAGRLAETIVDPDNGTGVAELDLTTQYVYDDASRLIRTIAPDGLITQTVYDNASRTIETIVDPDNGVSPAEFHLSTTYTYNPNGSLWKTTDPEGHVTERIYDRAGRLFRLIAPGGRETEYEYDENSRLIRETGPTGIVTAYQYDKMGRRTHTIVDPTVPGGPDELNLTTIVAYDRLGRQKSVTNPREKVTTFTYDAAGRLTKVTDAGSPAGELTYTYDDAGRIESVTDPEGSVTWYTYNATGQPTRVENAKSTGLERDWVRTYYLDGSLESATDPIGNETEYQYDGAGRLKAVDLTGEGTVVSYVYDEAGRTETITNYNGVIAYDYDTIGRVETVTDRSDTVAYTWNDIGQRTKITLPGSREVIYDYDETTADLESITDFSNAPGPTLYTYRDDGRLDTITRPTSTDPIVSTYGYDNAGRLTGISHSLDTTYLAEYGYTLDDNGNREVVTITGTEVVNGTETYTYDNLDRLISATYPGPISASFQYDKNGNRTEVQSAGITTTYQYDDLGQLTDITDDDSPALDISITYDANGNRKTVTDDTGPTITREYTWDWANRLTLAEVNSVSTEYEYLGDSTRASLDDGTQTDFLYDRLGGLPQVIDDGTNAYLHDVTGNSVAIDGTTDDATYPLSDALGSVRLVTDDEGTAIGDTNWDAWGNEQNSTGSQYEFDWTGEQYDESSDLTYLRARYYSPGTANFLSRDTVQPNAPGTGGYNPYSYANGNPVVFADPSGHSFVGSLPGFDRKPLAWECPSPGACHWTYHYVKVPGPVADNGCSASFFGSLVTRLIGSLSRLLLGSTCGGSSSSKRGISQNCDNPNGCWEDGSTPTPDPFGDYSTCKKSDLTQHDPWVGFISGGPTGKYEAGFAIVSFSLAFLPSCVGYDTLNGLRSTSNIFEAVGRVIQGITDSGACTGLPEPASHKCEGIVATLDLVANSWALGQDKHIEELSRVLDYPVLGQGGIAYLYRGAASDPFMDTHVDIYSQSELVYGADKYDINPCLFGIHKDFPQERGYKLIKGSHNCGEYWPWWSYE